MNKIYQLIWCSLLNIWTVCSKLAKKSKTSIFQTMFIVCTSLHSVSGFAAQCAVNANGTFSFTSGGANCEISAVNPEIGNSDIWNLGFFVMSSGATERTMTITTDIETIVKGTGGIAVGNYNPDITAYFDAKGKTVDLAIANLDVNAALPEGDNFRKTGLSVGLAGTAEIGTLNLTMLDLPPGKDINSRFEHYGLLLGSSNNAPEGAPYNGLRSSAILDNLNIKMSSSNNPGFLSARYPLLAGIRVIQGAQGNSGLGSAGYLEVKENLSINLQGTSNDVIGIYISGSEQQGVVPEAHLNNSNITVSSTSTRANAIRLGKTASIGTGEGRLYSTGTMFLDTTNAKNSAAIELIWQGAVLDANADTSSTIIKAGEEAIKVSGDASQSADQTLMSFNNLTIDQTETDTASLISVETGQNDFQLNVRGQDSRLISNTGENAYIIDVDDGYKNFSNVTFNFSEGSLQGLTQKTDLATLNMNVSGGATWQLEANNSGLGKTASFTTLNLNGSTLIAHDVKFGHTTGNTSVSNFTLKGNIIANNSVIILENGVAGDQLTIDGNFTTGGNTWFFDSFLTGAGQSQDIGTDGKSYTDTIKITGSTLDGGTDWVRVSNLNIDEPTGEEIILLYSIDGDSQGQFSLQQRVVKGGYEYLLNKHGNGDWYLESFYTEKPVLRPEIGSYLANASAGNNLFVHRLEDRIGASNSFENYTEPGHAWIRVQGGTQKYAHQTDQLQTHGDSYLIHAGIGLFKFTEYGEFNAGLMGAWGQFDAKTKSNSIDYSSSSKLGGFGLGLYGTWFQNPGEHNSLYIDGWLLWNKFDNEANGQTLSTEKYDSSGIIASLEIGKAFRMGQINGTDLWIQPQGQLVYQDVQSDNFTEENGTRVNHGDANLQTRLGIKAYLDISVSETTKTRPYVAVNWIHNTNRMNVRLDNTSYEIGGDKNIGEIKLGIEGDISPNSRLWVNGGYHFGSHNLRSFLANFGWKLTF